MILKPSNRRMHPLARLDHRHVWHPFTQMRDWLRHEPIVIVEGEGAVLRDVRGREYLDANASIWTNLHGHNHPAINAAIRRQLGKIAHSSALGLANEPASRLAAKLVEMANPPWLLNSHGDGQNLGLRTPEPATTQGTSDVPATPDWRANPHRVPRLPKVFFSDDGSTALEVALKLAYEFARRTGLSSRPRFLSLEGAYHGDTVGAVSLGHIDLFHKAYAGLLFRSDRVMAPYCYRCPFNRAAPERADARAYRRCRWECVDAVEQRFAARRRAGSPYAGFVVEPLIQGAAGMIPQPAGWLARVAEIARGQGALLIADEVMTGFGRTGQVANPPQAARRAANPESTNATQGAPGRGVPRGKPAGRPAYFACHREGVQPDFLCLAKGLTGGYLPMAATLATQAVFDAFLGEYAEFKTFFHGHSYTGNQLGAAAALASLALLRRPAARRARQRLERALADELGLLWSLPSVGDVRQVGLVAGVELVRNWRTRAPFDLRERAGIRVCEAMARRGVLTRPIGNVVVLMPPYCATAQQVRQIVTALRESVEEVLGTTPPD